MPSALSTSIYIFIILSMSNQVFSVDGIKCDETMVALDTDPGYAPCTSITLTDTTMECCWMRYKEAVNKYLCIPMPVEIEAYRVKVREYAEKLNNVTIHCASNAIMVCLSLVIGLAMLIL